MSTEKESIKEAISRAKRGETVSLSEVLDVINIGDTVKVTKEGFDHLQFVIDGETEEGAFYNSEIRLGFYPKDLEKVK